MKFFVIALLVLGASAVRYDGYKIYSITPGDATDLEVLTNLWKEYEDALDFWREPGGFAHSADVMVPPYLQTLVEKVLTENNVDFEVSMDNVQTAIDNSPSVSATFDYNKYNTYGNIIQWVSDFAAANSDIVTVVSYGETLEGRKLSGLMIGVNQGSSKPAVYYQGGIHAREWISPATVINIVRLLVDDYRNNDATVVSMLNTFDYYILPLYNPDGYEFTQADEGDRLWRKNRNPNGIGCYGVDLNRNYPYQWSANGASDSKCSETYRGTGPASEVETQAITNFLINETRTWIGFIDFHSYSQLVLSPWSYSKTAILPSDSDELVAAGQAAVDALTAVYGTTYAVGPAARSLYAASGCSEDWGYATLGAKYSYVVELRPDGNPPGFLLPENQIQPTGEETYELVKSFGSTYLAYLE